MADNFAFTPGTGATGAADDIGGVLWPRVKVTWGPDGTANDTDVATGKPMPVQSRVSDGTAYTFGAGAVAGGSQRVTLGSDDPAVAALQSFQGTEYETVAASQTAQALGATGGTGDLITGILVIPATTSPGLVTLLDNAISIPVFVGGSSSVSNLVPFLVPLGIKSVSGAWKITTGANVSCIGMGNFT